MSKDNVAQCPKCGQSLSGEAFTKMALLDLIKAIDSGKTKIVTFTTEHNVEEWGPHTVQFTIVTRPM
jgi:hypothetical protein